MKGERFFRGFPLTWAITSAVMELDYAQQGKCKGYADVGRVKEILKKHYIASKAKPNYVSYDEEVALTEALVFDVIPETFNIRKNNCKSYGVPDYLAGLELVLEQFEDLQNAEEPQLDFLRKFLINLGNKRQSRYDSSSIRRYVGQVA